MAKNWIRDRSKQDKTDQNRGGVRQNKDERGDDRRDEEERGDER